MPKNDINVSKVSVLELPEKALTRDGEEYYPKKDRWTFKGGLINRHIVFTSLYDYCQKSLVCEYKKTLINELKQKAPASVLASHDAFVKFAGHSFKGKSKLLKMITKVDYMNYKGSGIKDADSHLSFLRPVFISWHNLGNSAIEPELPSFLREIPLKNRTRGVPVLTRDPEKGPFSDHELRGICAALVKGFSEGIVSTKGYATSLIYLSWAPRSIQIAALKVKDLVVIETEDSTKDYTLRIPKAKKRYTRMRSAFDNRKLIPEIGEVLEDQIELLRIDFEKFGNGVEFADIPMFPNWYGRSKSASTVKGFEHHSTSAAIGEVLSDTMSSLNVQSERTKGPLRLSPRRFRYTLGTRLAEEGYGELAIAEALGHADTQVAGVYVKSTSKILNDINKAVAKEFAPYVNAFAGRVVNNADEVVNSRDNRARVYVLRGKKDSGVCGRSGRCIGMAPIGCYLCRKFQAWEDGPHEKVLEYLISERLRVYQETGDERTMSANDDIIFAVQQVILLVEEKQRQREVNG